MKHNINNYLSEDNEMYIKLSIKSTILILVLWIYYFSLFCILIYIWFYNIYIYNNAYICYFNIYEIYKRILNREIIYLSNLYVINYIIICLS